MKQILVILVCLLFYTPLVVAQEPQPATISRDTRSRGSREVTIIIQQQQLRFAAPTSAQEVRLEIFNQAGEMVYDSGIISGAELSWALQNTSGETVPSGLYAYTLTIKEPNSETPALRRGHLILESGRDRLWVTNQGAIGAEAAVSGGELTVSSGPETSVAGARIGRAAAARSTFNLDFFGTPGRIPKFTGSDFLDDSVISQDFNGRIGIGTQAPGTALLTVAGQIETTSGGIKFPNGSVQTKAGLLQVNHNTSLTGNGTADAPLGVNIPALNILSSVATNETLVGNGTGASPLGLAVPLFLVSNSSLSATIEATNLAGPGLLARGSAQGVRAIGIDNNSGNAGSGVDASGGDSNSDFGGAGVAASGGNSNSGFGGAGVGAFGGDSNTNGAGRGMFAQGGNSNSSLGGDGIEARGGNGNSGGDGVVARGGASNNGIGGNGIVAFSGSGPAGDGVAGRFFGDAVVLGNLSKSGGSFKIDHPLDPANKYLSHSFVESPDMMNIYNGLARLDANGEAIVELPEWFEALNKEFRYLLTPVGAPMPGLYIAQEVSDHRFRIAGGQPGLKVSWQVTGIRQDAYANKHRIPVEEKKPERERGYYLHPQLFDQPEEKSVEWARNPEMMRRIKSQRLETDVRNKR